MEYSVTASLETPAGTLTFNAAAGDTYYLSGITGMDGASVRAPVEPLPGRDGAKVYDFWNGARYPVISGQLVASTFSGRRLLEDNLRAAAQSILRTDGTLKWTPSGGSGRQLTVRALEPVQITGPVLKAFQLALIAGDPVIYAQTEQNSTSAGLSVGTGSLVFPFLFPFSFGDASAGGTVTVTNGGNVSTLPKLRLYGKLVAPIIHNLTTGEIISLPGLTINAGDYVEIDCNAETILLNGSTDNSLIRYLDAVQSTFFSLGPGITSLQVTAGQFDVSAYLKVYWRDAWA